MNDRLRRTMTDALHLTRDGKLKEAAARLRGLLGGAASSWPPAPGSGRGATLDLEPDRVEVDAPAPRRPAGPRPRRAPAPDATARLAELPGSFATASFVNAAGGRSYKLYVPARLPTGRVPLVVMLHGCTQSPDDFAIGTGMNALAEREGLLVAYPGQDAAANPNRCWNWFLPKDQERGDGEPSIIAGIAGQVMREHAVDPARVYVAGLSAGGAAAAILAAAYPDLFAAVGVHSGLPVGCAQDLPTALMAMRQGPAGRPIRAAAALPTIILHGDEDAVVHPRNGEALAEAALAGVALRPRREQGGGDGGHAWTRDMHEDPAGRVLLERWTIHGAGHAWSGGSAAGSYTDPRGPDASAAMLQFFLSHRRGG